MYNEGYFIFSKFLIETAFSKIFELFFVRKLILIYPESKITISALCIPVYIYDLTTKCNSTVNKQGFIFRPMMGPVPPSKLPRKTHEQLNRLHVYLNKCLFHENTVDHCKEIKIR